MVYGLILDLQAMLSAKASLFKSFTSNEMSGGKREWLFKGTDRYCVFLLPSIFNSSTSSLVGWRQVLMFLRKNRKERAEVRDSELHLELMILVWAEKGKLQLFHMSVAAGDHFNCQSLNVSTYKTGKNNAFFKFYKAVPRIKSINVWLYISFLDVCIYLFV